MGMGDTSRPPRPWKCCKVFCALVFTVKRSADQLFMHYFHNFSSASGGFAPDPYQDSIPDPPGGLSFTDPLICPPLKKNPAGAHADAQGVTVTEQDNDNIKYNKKHIVTLSVRDKSQD